MPKLEAEFRKFYEFAKMEEKPDGTHEVWGIATLEQPDSDNEICCYETAVPVYQAWSSKALKRTSGNGQEPSLGNLRVQHGSEVGGKVTKLEFKDSEKEIWLGSEPIDSMVTPLKKGMYTGYSQGGSYAWRSCADCDSPMPMEQGNNYCKSCKKTVPVMYGLKRISEVSYVDSPAIGIGFQSVKANGSCEMVKFSKKENVVMKTKRVAGEDLPAANFAHVGDPEKTDTWKLPIKFSSEEKTKRHIRNALARIDQTKGMSDDEKTKAKEKIHAAATTHGIDVAESSAKSVQVVEMLKAHIDKTAESRGMAKGLYAVSRAAEMLQGFASLWEQSVYEREIEGDDSEVPDELKDLLDSFTETFIAMATEEARELAANKKADTSTGDKTMTPEEIAAQEALQKAAKKSLASHFAKMSNFHEKKADHHEALAEHHDALADLHKAAHSGMKKADVNEEGQAEPKGSGEFMAAGAQFHKAAASEHEKMAGRHEKLAKAHDAMCEHCDKMAKDSDVEEAAKAIKELKEADAAIAKAEGENVAIKPTVTPEDEFTRKSIQKAQDDLLNDPDFQAEVKSRQRAILLGKLAESGAEALKNEQIVPTTVKAGGAPGLVARGGADAKFEFAKDSSEGPTTPGF